MSPRTLERHICVFFLSCVLMASLLRLRRTSGGTSPRQNNSIWNLSENNAGRVAPGHFSETASEQNKHIVYILGLFELTTKWGERAQGRSEIAAAQMAIRHINEHNLLPDYTIKLLTNDTKCDPGVGIDTFFHAIYSEKTIAALLGTSCSNVTESLAHVVPYWNILQISSGSTSPSLSDRKKFPLFFRTVAPDSSHTAAKMNFVKHFGWKTVATFCQSEDDYLLPINNLISEFEQENVTCMATITFSLDNYKDQLRALQTSEVRIIIGSFSSQLAPKIFCETYKLGMYGTDYVWILQHQEELWWNDHSECEASELNEAVDGLILVTDYNYLLENDTSVSGLTNNLFDQELAIPKTNISKYATLTYDAVWAIALTLRNLEAAHQRGHFRNFDYGRKDIVYDFVRQMSVLSFIGISGPVKFIGADRLGSSLIQQLQGGKVREVAIYNSNGNRLDFRCALCGQIAWQGGQVPMAQRILRIYLISIPRSLFYLTVLISVMGVATSLLFLFFNLHFRRMKTVKLSSPKLNNVAVFGCILVYVYVSLLGVDTRGYEKYFTELCTMRVYLLSTGFALAFGSTFAKTYRIHRIFAHYGGPAKVKDKLLKDKQLILLILVPPLIDAIIVSLWVMVDPLERQLYNLTLEINFEDRQVVYQPQIEVCRSHNTIGWFIALYGYKGLILIMGVFMAWETRHVKVAALNDSQYIGICVYSAVFAAIITALSSLITKYFVLSYVAEASSILISTSLTLFLLFLPKLKSVFNRINCQADPVMQSMGLKIECNTRRFVTDDPREQMYRLEVQNKVYRCELRTLNLEIARLENLLSQQSGVGAAQGLFTIFKGDCIAVSGSWPSIGKPAFMLTDCDYTKVGFEGKGGRDAASRTHQSRGSWQDKAAARAEGKNERLGNRLSHTF